MIRSVMQGLNGTCYTQEECRERKGAATSSCAGQEDHSLVLFSNVQLFRRIRSLLYLWSVLWWKVFRKLHIPHHRDYTGTGK